MSAAVTTDPLALDVLLPDGTIATVRPLHALDGDAVAGLPGRTLLRSASGGPVDDLGRLDALVACVHGEVVALAGWRAVPGDPGAALLALHVGDAHLAQGVAALLLEHLASLARHRGVRVFVAEVPPRQAPVLRLLDDSGFAVGRMSTTGADVVRLDLSEGPVLWDAVRRREAAAQVASLWPVLSPRSVAVVGSTRSGSVAELVREALLGPGGGGDQTGAAAGFAGSCVSVGSHERLTSAVDLVVVVVPAARVLAVAQDAAALGCRGLLVLSAGFAEEGPAGALLQAELVGVCRRAGMRLVGPNCLGILNTDPQVRLNATFCDAQPLQGTVALVSQSGAVGIAALRHAERAGVGLSLFVSTGNKADVSGNDLLAHLRQDPRTTVVGMYLESFGNARRFARTAAEVSRTKPVVVLKAGSTAAGARAGMSHTAACATPALALEAIFHEAGVVQADDLPELFDLLSTAAHAPLPRGPRIAVLGNSGGPGVLAADASTGAGLSMAELSLETQAALRTLLPPSAAVDNPVDLLATVRPEVYEQALRVVLADPGVDAVVAIFTPVRRGTEAPYAAAMLAAAVLSPTTPLLAVFPGVGLPPPALRGPTGELALPFFEFAEPAVRALGKVTRYAAWRAQVPGPSTYVVDEARRDRATVLLDVDDGWLGPAATSAVLEEYGIPTAKSVEVVGPDAAAAAADVLGYPVALKAVGVSIVHKADVGGVVLGLTSAEGVRTAHALMLARVGPAMTSALVQQVHPTAGALEMLLGLTVDPAVGPLVLVGEGGTWTELLDDRAVRMPAQTREAAREQVAGLRCARRFQGYRGAPPLDGEAVVDVLMALAAMTRELPQVLELDLNPLLVAPSSVCVLDARLRVGPPVPTQERGSHSLSVTPPAH